MATYDNLGKDILFYKICSHISDSQFAKPIWPPVPTDFDWILRIVCLRFVCTTPPHKPKPYEFNSYGFIFYLIFLELIHFGIIKEARLTFIIEHYKIKEVVV